ncbi:MAG: glycosyltransferase family 4 protein [Flavisolibacter sp.]
MKILFISRATLYTNKGGDTVQVLNTAKSLRLEGVTVDVKLCNERIDYNKYDLIHFFGIIRPADVLQHIYASQKPYVISTIYVDYAEFDRNVRKGFTGFLFKLFPADFIEYVKVIARSIFNGEKIISPQYLWLGHRKSIKKIIRGSAFLLPNSENEYKRLVAAYGIQPPYQTIPNAIDAALFCNDERGEKDNNLVLCVGRIEGLKNQLNLIKALNNTTFQLLIIGTPTLNQPEYYKICRKAASNNVRFIENMPQQELVQYYAKAKVHVLPSWFETTGLSSLEAGAMGCNIVITDKGDTKEYFEEMAFYCDPSSPASIREAIEKAANAPSFPALRKKIITQYTWSVAAAKTLEVYRKVLYNY